MTSEDDRKLQERAERGDPEAMFGLGCRLFVSGHQREAIPWLRAAARSEHPGAWYLLGMCLAEGWGVERDEAKAVEWLTRASEHGLAVARERLGMLYEEGRGVPRDEVRAAACYREAAEQNRPEAQYRLALMHLKGRGVKADLDSARALLGRAAAQGHERAEQALRLLDDKIKEMKKEEAERDIFLGLLFLIIGIIVTFGTYAAARPGEHYIIAWGAILFGGLQFLRGLARSLK